MEVVYPVLVIGAGISGLSASWQLSKNGINHILIESRDRIGGRIASKEFEGGVVHLGASFVHCPQDNNRIGELVKEWDWKTESADYQSMQYVLEGRGEVDQQKLNQVQMMVEPLLECIKESAEHSHQDISLEQASLTFLKGIEERDQEVQSLVKWHVNIFGNIEGAQLRQISAKQFENDEAAEDYLPNDGYISIIQKIYGFYQPKVEFNQKVIKIDYADQPIKVHTTNKVYLANKIISSLPLGVIQAQLVHFYPNLPLKHQVSIKKMGNGVANKIIVRFKVPFWDVSKKWINFVTQEQNKYPVAITQINDDRFILCFFISGDASKEMSECADQQIKNDLQAFLNRFNFKEPIKIAAMEVTRWHKDPHSLGSYSYIPVGTTAEDIKTLRSPIDHKIWFIGEHCHPQMNACAHSAFQTGLWAANEVISSLND